MNRSSRPREASLSGPTLPAGFWGNIPGSHPSRRLFAPRSFRSAIPEAPEFVVQPTEPRSPASPLSLSTVILQPKDLPQQPNLPERPLAAQQCRRRLVLVLWLLHLFAYPLVRRRHPRQRSLVYPRVQALHC